MQIDTCNFEVITILIANKQILLTIGLTTSSSTEIDKFRSVFGFDAIKQFLNARNLALIGQLLLL